MQPGLWPCAFAVSFREWCGPWGHRQLFGCGQKAWYHPGWCWWSFFCSQAVRGPAVFLNSFSPRFAPSYNDAVGLTKTNWWIMTGFFWCQEFRGKNPRSEQNWEKNGSFDITYQPPWNINSIISSPKCQLQVARLQYDGRLAGPLKNGIGMMICWVGSPVMFFPSNRHILLFPTTIKNVGSSLFSQQQNYHSFKWDAHIST